MTFSWKKKTRCNRFSQLVADHLQSPKRGGSLVVETGFPTSLIDLYVRNRGRFQNSSTKKQREIDSPTPLSSCSSPPSSGLLLDSYNFSSSSSSDSFVDSNNSDSRGTDEIIEEDVVVGVGFCLATSDCEIRSENFSKAEVESSSEMVKLNPVFVVVLKVLLMAVLVLGTKRFTIGITMSAFLLLFLEFVGKLLFRRSSSVKLAADLKTPPESSFEETMNAKSLEDNTSTTLAVCNGLLEIEEHVESKQEISSEKKLEQVRSQVLMEMKHKSSQRATMKSRMKNLASKKLRKLSVGSKEETSSGFIEEEPLKSSQDFKTLVLKQNEDEIAEIDCNDKKLGIESHQNSGCLVLCFIVLVGLIGGRVSALVLALSWCLMLSKLQWRNVKFPIS